MSYLGDFDAGDTIYHKFTTVSGVGASITLAGGTVAAYKDNSTTQTLTGVTLTANFDNLTGLHHITIDTSQDGSFYANGSDFQLILVSGTVDGNSVIGYAVGAFSLRNRANLYPTTAGRMLDVSAGGEAGIDWANIGSPTTAQNLSATNIDVDQVVASVSGNVGGNVAGSVGSVAAGGITAASIATDAIDADAIADNAINAGAIADNAITAAKIADGAIDANTFATGAITAASLAADASAEIADAVWDEDATGHQTQGSFGQVIGDSGADSDSIWALANTNLDAAVSTRATPAQVNTEVDTALADVNLDHLVGTASGIPAIPAGTYIDQMMDDGTAVYDRTTDSLQAIRDRGDSAWITSTLTAADVWNAATRTLTAFSFSVTVGTNNDKTGYSLSAAGVQAIWDALTSALTTAGSIGKLLVDNINATISSRSSHTAADVWAVATRLLTAGTNIVLAKGVGVTGFNDISTSDVNAQVLDVIAVDTYAEPGQEAPPETTTLAVRLRYLYKGFRNRYTQTSSQFSLYADNGTTVDQKATVSDDLTTFDRGEIGSGP